MPEQAVPSWAAGFEHAHEVASAAVALHRGFPDWELLSERELRVEESDRGELLASALLAGAEDLCGLDSRGLRDLGGNLYYQDISFSCTWISMGAEYHSCLPHETF